MAFAAPTYVKIPSFGWCTQKDNGNSVTFRFSKKIFLFGYLGICTVKRKKEKKRV
jgi:hypothetical protein